MTGDRGTRISGNQLHRIPNCAPLNMLPLQPQCQSYLQKYVSLAQTKLKRHRAHQYRFYLCFIWRGYTFFNSYSQCRRQGLADLRVGQRGPKPTGYHKCFGFFRTGLRYFEGRQYSESMLWNVRVTLLIIIEEARRLSSRRMGSFGLAPILSTEYLRMIWKRWTAKDIQGNAQGPGVHKCRASDCRGD